MAELVNKALEINDKLAPFLTPMPSSDESLIKTVADFALELSPIQNRRLTQLELLAMEPKMPPHQAAAIRKRIELYERRKRYHGAKDFIADLAASLSWKRFADQNQMAGKVDKVQHG